MDHTVESVKNKFTHYHHAFETLSDDDNQPTAEMLDRLTEGTILSITKRSRPNFVVIVKRTPKRISYQSLGSIGVSNGNTWELLELYDRKIADGRNPVRFLNICSLNSQHMLIKIIKHGVGPFYKPNFLS
tara:strand:+ start:67 stop:456 length:390 start_codon:yes stop_codon:yes gene_type:complete